MAHCKYGCNGTGVIVVAGKRYPCPEHQLSKKDKIMGITEYRGVDILSYLNIPMEYRETYWEPNIDNIFRGKGILNLTDDSVTRMKAILNEIMNKITYENTVTTQSYMFYPSMLDLNRYFYTLQKIAVDNKITTVPIITINELSQIMKLQDYPYAKYTPENLDYLKENDRIAYEGLELCEKLNVNYLDYLTARLVIIRDTSMTGEYNLKIFKGFLEERGYKGLPTYVVTSSYIGYDKSLILAEEGSVQTLTKLTPIQLESRRVQKLKDEEDKGIKAEEEDKNKIDFGELFGI